MKFYKTSEIAKLADVHPNTVRLYEQWGYIDTVPRGFNGYRLYTETHLEQMILARIAFRCDFAVGDIRKQLIQIIKTSAKGQYDTSLQLTKTYCTCLAKERQKAQEALQQVKRWQNGLEEKEPLALKRKEAAQHLHVTAECLRNWERNGLLQAPRPVGNGYRIYNSSLMGRLKVIRTLRAANYSLMAIMRMLQTVDAGLSIDDYFKRAEYFTDMHYATDHWLETLKRTENDAADLIKQLRKMRKKLTN